LRAYYPRFSYLDEYLPAAYREDETSAWFLDRFLANAEGLFTALEGRIAGAESLFDVRTAPGEYLDWLAGWLGATLDPAWSDERRRLLLNHAVDLFRQRGTLPGVIRAVRLAIDPCPDDSLFESDVLAESTGTCASACKIGRYTVRVVERFVTRGVPGVAYGDPTLPDVPRLTTGDEPWGPEQGAGPLHRHFRTFLRARYGTVEALAGAWGTAIAAFEEVRLSPVVPAGVAQAADWRQFTQHELSFAYAEVTTQDAPRYRAFLTRRYRQIANLNSAYGTGYRSFLLIGLPGESDMPDGGRRLYDWIQFVSLVLPIERHAHRFMVLVPVDPGRDMAAQAEQLALAERIVAREKPAHTAFEVQPYWALFRVGEARLGLDTLLGASSRFVAVLLGQTYLAEGYLSASHPWNVTDRIVSDRDAIPGGAAALPNPCRAVLGAPRARSDMTL
jgi:phage tail-like protein